MQQLKFKDLARLFEELKKKYTIEEIMEMPIRRLQGNGEYTCWDYAKKCSEDDKEIFIN